MNCDNIDKWIQLNKKGDLSVEERNMLNEHISKCDSCSDLVLKFEKTDILINNLRNSEPELTYPQVLTSNIMDAIENKENSRFITFSLNGFFDLLFSNKVKVLAYAVIIGLIGLFSVQQLYILNKLNQMEQKIAVNPNQDLDLLITPYNVNTKLIKEFASGIKEEQIVLDKKSVEQFIEIYKDLKSEHNDLREFLNKNIRDLERKLSKEDLKKLKHLLKEDDSVKNLSTNL